MLTISVRPAPALVHQPIVRDVVKSLGEHGRGERGQSTHLTGKVRLVGVAGVDGQLCEPGLHTPALRDDQPFQRGACAPNAGVFLWRESGRRTKAGFELPRCHAKTRRNVCDRTRSVFRDDHVHGTPHERVYRPISPNGVEQPAIDGRGDSAAPKTSRASNRRSRMDCALRPPCVAR